MHKTPVERQRSLHWSFLLQKWNEFEMRQVKEIGNPIDER